MADDAPTTPADKQLAQWLRALADVVESDPALAARVTSQMSDAHSEALSASAPPAHSVVDAAPTPDLLPVAPAPVVAEAPLPVPAAEATAPALTPTLRHTRKTSRFGPSVTGRPAELGTGVPDPFAIYAGEREEGLRTTLGLLRIGTLRAIIRAHNLDPAGKIGANATEKRLISAIVAAVKRAARAA